MPVQELGRGRTIASYSTWWNEAHCIIYLVFAVASPRYHEGRGTYCGVKFCAIHHSEGQASCFPQMARWQTTPNISQIYITFFCLLLFFFTHFSDSHYCPPADEHVLLAGVYSGSKTNYSSAGAHSHHSVSFVMWSGVPYQRCYNSQVSYTFCSFKYSKCDPNNKLCIARFHNASSRRVTSTIT